MLSGLGTGVRVRSRGKEFIAGGVKKVRAPELLSLTDLGEIAQCGIGTQNVKLSLVRRCRY